MKEHQLPVRAAQTVLYVVAGLLVLWSLGLIGSLLGIVLVPPVVLAVIGLIILARRLGQGPHGPHRTRP
ncbi:hypothetical protein ACQB60_24490 [Actinomycetota bacterium Odt1-20B]